MNLIETLIGLSLSLAVLCYMCVELWECYQEFRFDREDQYLARNRELMSLINRKYEQFRQLFCSHAWCDECWNHCRLCEAYRKLS